MVLHVNYKSGVPVYLQVVDQVKVAAASGALRTGDPLPSIRPLAEELRVNRNTIAKAYAELESQGIIETIPGKGCFLKQTRSPFSREVRREMLVAGIDAAIAQAHHSQINPKDFLELVKERLALFETRTRAAGQTPKGL